MEVVDNQVLSVTQDKDEEDNVKKTTCLLYGSLLVLAMFATIIGLLAYGNLGCGARRVLPAGFL